MDGQERKVTRRRVLAGALAGAGVLAAASAGTAAVLLTRGDGDEQAAPEPTTSPTPAPVATATATATPTPTSPQLLSFLEPSHGAFERVSFAPTDTIDWKSGVFYMDTATGAITGYRLALAPPRGPQHYVTPAGPRFVLAVSPEVNRAYLLDRTSGGEWAWAGAAGWQEAAASDDYVIFAEREAYRETGRYALAGADLRTAVEYKSGRQTWSQWVIQGGVAAVAFQDGPRDITLVDLATGAARTVFTAADMDGMTPWGTLLGVDQDGAFTALVTYYEGEPSAQGPAGPALFLRQRIAPDGRLLDSSTGGDWLEAASPDGRYRVRQAYLAWKPAVGEGSGEIWPATVVLDAASGQPLTRVRSAALSYGDNLPLARWLADSSAFVALVRDPGEPSIPAAPFRYALFTPAGEMELLPLPPVAEEHWFTRPYNLGPVPSPHDPDLLSFGRYNLYNRRTGVWSVPKLTDTAGPAHWSLGSSPWEAGPGEMVFALGHGGHGGSPFPSLVTPLVERAPFEASPAPYFVVQGTGSCLNLREKPDRQAAVTHCLPEGTVLTLDPEGEALWEQATQGCSYTASDDGTWVLVRAPGGLRGWVAGQYLGWWKG